MKDDVLEALGLATPVGNQTESVSLRLDPELLQRLDKIEAVLRGEGIRFVTRSRILRAAAASYCDVAEAALSVDA